MKRNFCFWMVPLLLLFSGCSKNSGEEDSSSSSSSSSGTGPDGWELVEWNGSSSIAGLVYLQLADGLFTLYQQIGDFSTAGYTVYTGTYTLTGDSGQGALLSGVYSDGTSWLDSYVVEVWTDSELRLCSLSEGIVSVYASVVIPDYVKAAPVSVSALSVASGSDRFEGPFL